MIPFWFHSHDNSSPILIKIQVRYAHPIAEETEGYRSFFGGLPYYVVSPPLQKGVGAVITPSPSILAPRSFLGRGGSSRWSSSSSRSRMPGLREKIDFTPPQGWSTENQEAIFSLFSYISFITPFTLTIYTDLVFFCLEIFHSLLEKIGILDKTRYWPESCRGYD